MKWVILMELYLSNFSIISRVPPPSFSQLHISKCMEWYKAAYTWEGFDMLLLEKYISKAPVYICMWPLLCVKIAPRILWK